MLTFAGNALVASESHIIMTLCAWQRLALVLDPGDGIIPRREVCSVAISLLSVVQLPLLIVQSQQGV